MAGLGFITNHPLLTALGAITLFAIWKFIVQPIMNEGEPLNPTEDQVEGNFGLDNMTN